MFGDSDEPDGAAGESTRLAKRFSASAMAVFSCSTRFFFAKASSASFKLCSCAESVDSSSTGGGVQSCPPSISFVAPESIGGVDPCNTASVTSVDCSTCRPTVAVVAPEPVGGVDPCGTSPTDCSKSGKPVGQVQYGAGIAEGVHSVCEFAARTLGLSLIRYKVSNLARTLVSGSHGERNKRQKQKKKKNLPVGKLTRCSVHLQAMLLSN